MLSNDKIIELKNYEQFLRKSGIPEDQIKLRVTERFEFEMTQVSSAFNAVSEKKPVSAFFKIPDAIRTRFYKNIENEDGFLKKIIVNGMVSDDVLTSPRYTGFMNRLQSLANRWGVNVFNAQRVINKRFENFFRIEGKPMDVFSFNQDLRTEAEKVGIDMMSLTESNQLTPKQEIDNPSENLSPSEKLQKKYNYSMTDSVLTIKGFEGVQESTLFAHINSSLIKDLFSEMDKAIKESSRLIAEVKSNESLILLKKYIKEIQENNSQELKDSFDSLELIEKLKNNEDITTTESSKKIIENKDIIIRENDSYQKRVDDNLEKLHHLTKVIAAIQNKVEKIDDNKVSLLLRRSKNNFKEDTNQHKFSTGKTFLEMKRLYMGKMEDLSILNKEDPLSSKQIITLRQLSNAANSKAEYMYNKVEKYTQELNELAPKVEERFHQFNTIVEMIGSNPDKKDKEEIRKQIKEVTTFIEMVDMKRYLFQKSFYEDKKEMAGYVNELYSIRKDSVVNSKIGQRKIVDYNDNIYSGLSLVVKRMINNGFGSFEDVLSKKIQSATKVPFYEVDAVKKGLNSVKFFRYTANEIKKRERLGNCADFVLAFEDCLSSLQKISENMVGMSTNCSNFELSIEKTVKNNSRPRSKKYLSSLSESIDLLRKQYDYEKEDFQLLVKNKIMIMGKLLEEDSSIIDGLKRVPQEISKSMALLAKESNVLEKISELLNNQFNIISSELNEKITKIEGLKPVIDNKINEVNLKEIALKNLHTVVKPKEKKQRNNTSVTAVGDIDDDIFSDLKQDDNLIVSNKNNKDLEHDKSMEEQKEYKVELYPEDGPLNKMNDCAIVPNEPEPQNKDDLHNSVNEQDINELLAFASLDDRSQSDDNYYSRNEGPPSWDIPEDIHIQEAPKAVEEKKPVMVVGKSNSPSRLFGNGGINVDKLDKLLGEPNKEIVKDTKKNKP
jgi:hypothetical protein